ncbi:MAG TPA: AMP-binding protein, partial [Candidatus Limnocylindrales bacterium]|nr:AMP-binding protein [Candidatus Limnocylindrales bacterium]
MQAAQPPLLFNFAADVVDRWAAIRPHGLALWHVHATSRTQQKLTFRQIASLSRQAANFLRSCGITQGDRVLLMLPRVPQWWVAMLGLIRLGALPVPATLLLTSREVAYRLKMAAIHAVITNGEGIPKIGDFDGIRIAVAETSSGTSRSSRTAWPDGWLDFDSGLEQAKARFSRVRTRSDEPGILYFTSATTGEAKMVLHTQASYGLGHRITGELWLDLKPGELHWNISDLGWAKAAWSSFFGPWQMGACVFALEATGKFDPLLTLNTLAQFPIKTWCAPATALRLIVRQDLSRFRFHSLRHCVTAGEPLNPEVLNLWRTATGLTLHEGFGQTETVALIANCPSLDHVVKPGSMGKALPPFDVRLLDDRLNQVPAGTEGEIAIRVKPQRPLGLFREYWLNPEENARKFQGDFYLTGDRAVRDDEGYFWFIGRSDDVIKSSGYRIGPFEVESALLEHPAVLEAGVVGKPDPLRGQIVKAWVVLRPGIAYKEELKLELQAHCKKLVAAYKYPREIEFVSELPKTTSGKTRHFELRQASMRGLAT